MTMEKNWSVEIGRLAATPVEVKHFNDEASARSFFTSLHEDRSVLIGELNLLTGFEGRQTLLAQGERSCTATASSQMLVGDDWAVRTDKNMHSKMAARELAAKRTGQPYPWKG